MNQKSDFVLPFQLDKAPIRGRFVRLGDTLHNIIDRHKYPHLVNLLLEELIALTTALANLFKYEGVFTLQISGDGPIRLMVVDVTHEGEIRACARFTEEAVLKLPPSMTSVYTIFGTGYLAFTIVQNSSDDRYQGIVDLDGSTISECLHHFFRKSDQLETGIVVYSSSHYTNDSDHLAGAIIIQRMPSEPGLSFEQIEQENDAWLRSLSVLGTTTSTELLSKSISAEDLLYRLFWEDGIRTFESRPIIARCHCSKDRVETMLKTFSASDIQGMIENEAISVVCEFCSQEYKFDPNNFLMPLASEPLNSDLIK